MEKKNLDTKKAEEPISLLKLHPDVSRTLQSSSSATSSSATGSSASDKTIGKIIKVANLLPKDNPSSEQFFFEIAGGESCYKLNIAQDCLAPMYVISETKQGKLEVEGKIVSVLNMEPHFDKFADYSKSFRERTRTPAAETRGIKVIDIGHDAALKAWEAANQVAQNVEAIKKQLIDHLREPFIRIEELKRCSELLNPSKGSSDAPIKSMKMEGIQQHIIEDVNQLFLNLEEFEGRLQALQLNKASSDGPDKKLDANAAASGSQPASTDLKGKGKVTKKGRKQKGKKEFA